MYFFRQNRNTENQMGFRRCSEMLWNTAGGLINFAYQHRHEMAVILVLTLVYFDIEMFAEDMACYKDCINEGSNKYYCTFMCTDWDTP